jgi:tRNA pseudouridine55 synthase
MSDLSGYLLVDKPASISSFGIVARIRRIIREETGHKIKIGHTGTLDPAATGLMILVLGSYTKRAAEFSKLDKTYEAELTLGLVSTTGDKEGKISVFSKIQPKEDQVAEVINEFIGDIYQVPPAHSAIKIGGQRAYKLARQGRPVKIEPRKITIYDINHVAYDYPKLRLTASVSTGTYIRSLAADVGNKLGTGAYLSNLRRVSVNKFNVKDAISTGNLTVDIIKRNLQTSTGVAKVL